MTLPPVLRTRLFAAAGSILAIALGVQVAQGTLFWPGLMAAGFGLFLLARIQPLPIATVLLGAITIGYIVGNRGFAQLSPTRSLPLLPAECVLLVGGITLLLDCARQRRLPFETDALNLSVLLWMIAGTCRVVFDVGTFGAMAIRDYALVYYGAFFFLAQHVARDPGGARFLRGCVLTGCVVLLLVHPFYHRFPGFFLDTLTVRGVPLIFYKDDLTGNFMAVASLLFFDRFERTRRWRHLALSVIFAGAMLTTNSRSSMVALGIGALWFAVGGRWRFAAALGTVAVAAIAAFAAFSHFRNQPWEQTPLHGLYERALSIVDPLGERQYRGDNTFFKGDNNVFRMVWWRATIDEAVDAAPWLGLGFGYDLADRFVRAYYPEDAGTFSARSPHNVLITIFARMGTVGFVLFLAVLAAAAQRTFRALRDRTRPDAGALWCGAWVMLICACFGVVLEGPMGAVVFWTILGLAHAQTLATGTMADAADAPSAATAAAPHLPTHASVRELRATS